MRLLIMIVTQGYQEREILGCASILSHTLPWPFQLSRRVEMFFLWFSATTNTYECCDICQGREREEAFWISARGGKVDPKGSNLSGGQYNISKAHREKGSRQEQTGAAGWGTRHLVLHKLTYHPRRNSGPTECVHAPFPSSNSPRPFSW